ncbi:MAG: RNA methyltransferase [Spirulinaceae cyanobacterium]
MVLAGVRIILVEPAGALNVGSVARVMKNMGLQQLILVNPQCDVQSLAARKMAMHGRDVLEQAQQVETLPLALQGCQRAMATTARSRAVSNQFYTPREGISWLLGENLSSALIFGREDRGLSNEELNYAQKFISIPANPEYPSLNLAQAVAVCTYELYLACQDQRVSTDAPETATLDVLEGYYQQLEDLLLKIGYLYPHTAKARMEKLRRLYNRGNLTQEEVAMLRGILRQMNWASRETS